MPQLNRDTRHPVTFTLNGKKVSGHAEPRMLLSDFLLNELGLTSMHVGCEHGVCGACTLLLDGKVARSCLTFAVQADGREIETVEGLTGADGELTALQKAFRKHHALQCGYCTPGILMSLTAYLKVNPKPTEEELRDMLSGHLCRCTGYVG
ncbi:MAG: (2Fe-2S)-binding protein, partial [Alphaproteobacteria bacterium]